MVGRKWDGNAFVWRRIVMSGHSRLPSGTRAVLIALSFFGDADGNEIFPSQEAIAVRAGKSARSVRDHTQIAVEDGWLTREEVDTGKGYFSYRYTLCTPVSIANIAAIDPGFHERPPENSAGGN